MGHAPHSSTLVVIYVVRLLFVLFYVLFVCKCVLPPGDNPIAVNKYIISYHIIPRSVISQKIWIFISTSLTTSNIASTMTNHIYLIRGVTPCSLGGNCQLLGEQNAFIVNLFSNLKKRKQYAPLNLWRLLGEDMRFYFSFILSRST